MQPAIDREEAVKLLGSMEMLIAVNDCTPSPHAKIQELCVAVAKAATALIQAVDEYGDVSTKCMSGVFSISDIQRGVAAAEAYEEAKKNFVEAKRKLNEKK